jgi:hypothetical protein
MRNKTLILCTVLVVPLKTTLEKSGYSVRNVSDGHTHFVLVWRKILFVSLVRDKHSFVLSLYPLYLHFFAFCNYSLCFLGKVFTSPNQEHVCAYLGHVKLLGKRILHAFYFPSIWCLCNNRLFINQIKLRFCFEKIGDLFPKFTSGF